jgi:hypothetical protein
MISDVATLTLAMMFSVILSVIMGICSGIYLNSHRRSLQLAETKSCIGLKGEKSAMHNRSESETIRSFRNREIALKEFLPAIAAEENEIMIIGSSLKGLIQLGAESQEIAEELKSKISEGKVTVRFLLTHPAVADIRASQENRRSTEIGREIIQSLHILKEWHLPPENVRLYMGTPTCFAVRTGREMLLNPYPYTLSALNSPCLIVKKYEGETGHLYDAFSRSHFGAWDTQAATPISDFDTTIRELHNHLGDYIVLVSDLLRHV